MNSKPKTEEISAVAHAYDLTLWMLPHIASFSRQHRFTLGNRLEETALEVLETLVEASYASEKTALLTKANLCLERLRYLVRLCKDLHLFSLKQYEFAAESIHNLGSEIGGWVKFIKAKRTVAP
jgi:hypothetical protein